MVWSKIFYRAPYTPSQLSSHVLTGVVFLLAKASVPNPYLSWISLDESGLHTFEILSLECR